MAKVLLVVTEDWALLTHRLHLVKATINSGNEVAIATRVSKHREQLEQLGAKVYHWPLVRGSLNPLTELRAFIELYRIVRDFCPDLIHAVAIKPVIYTGFVTRFWFAGAIVFALGGAGYIFLSTRLKARILRIPTSLMLRLAIAGQKRRLILQNIDDFELFEGLGVVTSDKLRLIMGAGVETNVFEPVPLPVEETLIMLPARLLWDKGVGEFALAAKNLRSRFESARFVMVGELDEHNPNSLSKSQLETWLDEGNVEWWGNAEHEEMSEILGEASIVCLPSYREGLPKSLLEAAAMGRPIVTFDVAGCREIVISNFNGLLVPFADQNALERALATLISDRPLCEFFGRNGRQMIIEKFSDKVINKQTFEVWAELIE